MLLHVDRTAGKTAPAPAEILAALAEITEAQRDLPRPGAAGSGIGRTRPAVSAP
jgi:carnitine 3-dehydrogenase